MSSTTMWRLKAHSLDMTCDSNAHIRTSRLGTVIWLCHRSGSVPFAIMLCACPFAHEVRPRAVGIRPRLARVAVSAATRARQSKAGHPRHHVRPTAVSPSDLEPVLEELKDTSRLGQRGEWLCVPPRTSQRDPHNDGHRVRAGPSHDPLLLRLRVQAPVRRTRRVVGAIRREVGCVGRQACAVAQRAPPPSWGLSDEPFWPSWPRMQGRWMKMGCSRQ